MHSTAIVLLEIALRDKNEEQAFFAWWGEAKALLGERAKPVRLELLVSARGVYTILLETRVPGGFNVVAKDRPWQELDARRPASTMTVRPTRIWHDEGTRDITTSTLRAWLAERAAGKRDFLLVDALPAADFAERHIPGALSLPTPTIDAETAARVLGAPDRTVIVYCRDYD